MKTIIQRITENKFFRGPHTSALQLRVDFLDVARLQKDDGFIQRCVKLIKKNPGMIISVVFTLHE